MPPARVFLTGEPGCGKTTAILKILELLESRGMKVAGVVSREIRLEGVRMGFSLEDLMTHQTGTLAHVDQNEGPRVGKYRVNLDDIQRMAVTAISHAIAEADVVMVDELGPMELHSTPFIQAVETALASPRHFVGTIHKRANHPLVQAIKSNPTHQITEVTLANREKIPSEILQHMIGHA